MLSSKKNWPIKGLCGRCLFEFIDLRYSQSRWYFRPSCVSYCPSNLSSSPLPSSPLPCVEVQQTVCGWEGVGGRVIELCWRPYSAGVSHSCIWPDSEPTKLPNHSKQNLGGLTDKTCREVPLQVNLFWWRHFALLSINLIFSTYSTLYSDTIYSQYCIVYKTVHSLI
jgi:hypothetical protein